MVNYSKKYKHFDALVADYKPMKFKYFGYMHGEHFTNPLFQKPFIAIRKQLKSMFGLELTYFDLRTSLTTEQRKMGDMLFLTHCGKNHAEGAENVSRVELIRYFVIKMHYLPELLHIKSEMYTKHGKPISKLPDYVSMYLLRWHYLLNVDPKFVELVHGMDANEASLRIKGLVS